VKVLIGTRNPHKLVEIMRILGEIPGIEWVTFRERPFPEVPEEGATLEENAPGKGGKQRAHSLQGPSAVGDPILLLRGHLPQGPSLPFRDEHRVVTEAPPSPSPWWRSFPLEHLP